MKTYDVKIRATITKTERVEADNEDEAIELAHQVFNPSCTGVDESYAQDDLDIREVEGE